jgi:hypothetical protein
LRKLSILKIRKTEREMYFLKAPAKKHQPL